MVERCGRFVDGLMAAALAAGWRWVDGAWVGPDGVRYDGALDQGLNPGPDPLVEVSAPDPLAVPVQGSGPDRGAVGVGQRMTTAAAWAALG